MNANSFPPTELHLHNRDVVVRIGGQRGQAEISEGFVAYTNLVTCPIIISWYDAVEAKDKRQFI